MTQNEPSARLSAVSAGGRKASMRLRFATVAAASLVLTGAVGALLPSADAATPSLAKLKSTAKEYGELYTAQDWPDYWSLWASSVQHKLPEKKWAAFATKCNLGGAPMKLSNAIITPTGKGLATYSILGYSSSVTFVAQGDNWRELMSASSLKQALSDKCE